MDVLLFVLFYCFIMVVLLLYILKCCHHDIHNDVGRDVLHAVHPHFVHPQVEDRDIEITVRGVWFLHCRPKPLG